MTPQEQLNADTEKYAKNTVFPPSKFVGGMTTHPIVKDSLMKLNLCADSYKAGATSPTAANGCNKHVEIAKIDFAIKQLYWLNALVTFDNPVKQDIYKQVNELEQQIETLKKQQ